MSVIVANKKNNRVYEKQLPAAVESKKQLVDMTRMCLRFHLLPGLFLLFLVCFLAKIYLTLTYLFLFSCSISHVPRKEFVSVLLVGFNCQGNSHQNSEIFYGK